MADSLGNSEERLIIAGLEGAEDVSLPPWDIAEEVVDAVGHRFGCEEVLGLEGGHEGKSFKIVDNRVYHR
jgi:hypothetical protein